MQKGTPGGFFLTGARTHGKDSVITTNSTVLPEALYWQNASQPKGRAGFHYPRMNEMDEWSPHTFQVFEWHLSITTAGTNDLTGIPEKPSVETHSGDQTPGRTCPPRSSGVSSILSYCLSPYTHQFGRLVCWALCKEQTWLFRNTASMASRELGPKFSKWKRAGWRKELKGVE